VPYWQELEEGVLTVLLQHPITKKAVIAIKTARRRFIMHTSCLVAYGPAAIDAFQAGFLMGEFSPAARADAALDEFPVFLVIVRHPNQSRT
jgi:hypothetical protein